MVVGMFPIAKLGYLALRQVSKPIANIIKAQAKRSPLFRDKICVAPAQFYHYWETVIKMRMYGLGKPENVKELNKETAVELGADMLGEVVIFSLGALVIFLEYRRQSGNTAQRELSQTQRITELERSVSVLQVRVEELERSTSASTNSGALQKLVPGFLKRGDSASQSANETVALPGQPNQQPLGEATASDSRLKSVSKSLNHEKNPTSKSEAESISATEEADGPSPRQKIVYKLIKLIVDRDDD